MKTLLFTGKVLAGLFVLILVFTVTHNTYAQRGSAGSGGSGSGDQVQQQDRDQVQDPTSHDSDEPIQDQDRDRLQDGTGDGTPDQDRLQQQDRDRLQDGTSDGTPDQDQNKDRDRDRVHLDSVTALEEYVQTQQQNRLRALEQVREAAPVQSRIAAQIAAEAVTAAEPLLGRNGPQMSEVAQQVNQAISGLETREMALQNRSRVLLFLFGSDDEAVTAMQQEMEQNQNRIEQMQQFMRDCDDCNQDATSFLVTQIQNLEREQNRLQAVVDDAAGRQGLFGFLFGWLR